MKLAHVVCILSGTYPYLAYAHPGTLSPSTMQEFVSTDWLAHHYEDSNVVVIDTRPATEYSIGNIPHSINIPWATPVCPWISYGPDDLLLQLPSDEYLFGNLSAAGVSKYKQIVVSMSKASPPYPQAQVARVAMTLVLAGFPRVQILNGGFTKWTAEGRPVSTVATTLTPSATTGRIDRSDIVDHVYVHAAINKKIILDARDPAVYNGSVIEQWAQKPGHIPSAKSLSTAVLLLDANGDYKERVALMEVVKGVVGDHVSKDTEIIVYCGVGGYASSLYWVLTRVLGFCNVKFYDGSAQDWVKYYDMEV